MNNNQTDNNTNSVGKIAFGFDRKTDERSLTIFIDRFSNHAILETLIPRMDDDDINALVDICSGLMKKYLSEKEYHSLFIVEE